MNQITFDRDAKSVCKKEDIEWLRIWCEDTNAETLPHVALIGDSITEGYYPFVRELLADVAKVDYLATSYSIDSTFYSNAVKGFVSDSQYAVIHYNYGLHAFSVPDEIYELRCRELIRFLATRARSIVATTTTVLDDTLEEENSAWQGKVIARNEKLLSIASVSDIAVDDLNALCKTFSASERNPDGVHFHEEGYRLLAKQVAQSIRHQLERSEDECV